MVLSLLTFDTVCLRDQGNHVGRIKGWIEYKSKLDEIKKCNDEIFIQNGGKMKGQCDSYKDETIKDVLTSLAFICLVVDFNMLTLNGKIKIFLVVKDRGWCWAGS